MYLMIILHVNKIKKLIDHLKIILVFISVINHWLAHICFLLAVNHINEGQLVNP